MAEGVSYYELHVTMTGSADACALAVKTRLPNGWRYSRIDGDVNLGDGVKSYATKQLSRKFDESVVVDHLKEVAGMLSRYPGVTVIRRKVERVIYDDRSSKVRAACDGACPECHSDDRLPRDPLNGLDPLDIDHVDSYELPGDR